MMIVLIGYIGIVYSFC